MERRLIIKIGLILSLLVSFIAIIVWAMLLLTVATHNFIGGILTVVAFSITTFGMFLLYVGNRSVDEHSILWESEIVSHHIHNTISHPFHLDKPSIITGSVSGKLGPYEFLITDFFGTEKEIIEFSRTQQADFTVRPKVYVKGEGPEESTIGPLTLPAGNYAIKFVSHVGTMDAIFSLNKTVRKKPYEKLYEFGLTLLEVGVPVLITGVIHLSFATFAS